MMWMNDFVHTKTGHGTEKYHSSKDENSGATSYFEDCDGCFQDAYLFDPESKMNHNFIFEYDETTQSGYCYAFQGE